MGRGHEAGLEAVRGGNRQGPDRGSFGGQQGRQEREIDPQQQLAYSAGG